MRGWKCGTCAGVGGSALVLELLTRLWRKHYHAPKLIVFSRISMIEIGVLTTMLKSLQCLLN